MEPVIFKRMTSADIDAVSELVLGVFDESIAPLYEPEGVREFHAYASPQSLSERNEKNHFVILAQTGTEVVAVAEVRNNDHLAMLFVSGTLQRSGLGRAMLDRVIATCAAANPEIEQLTVHASPNSTAAYESMGFVATGPEQVVNGIRFTPMALGIETEEPDDIWD